MDKREEAIAALRECRKFIPSASNARDAAAADYLIARLEGREAAFPDAAPAQADKAEEERKKIDNKAGTIYLVGWVSFSFGLGGALGLPGLAIGFGVGVMVMVLAYALCDAIWRRPANWRPS